IRVVLGAAGSRRPAPRPWARPCGTLRGHEGSIRVGDLERAPWRESTPEEAADWLRRVPCRWWLAGGWAIERFVGSAIRRHGDLDVGCLRRDAAALTSALTGWEFYAASDGRLTPVRPGTAPEDRKSTRLNSSHV